MLYFKKYIFYLFPISEKLGQTETDLKEVQQLHLLLQKQLELKKEDFAQVKRSAYAETQELVARFALKQTETENEWVRLKRITRDLDIRIREERDISVARMLNMKRAVDKLKKVATFAGKRVSKLQAPVDDETLFRVSGLCLNVLFLYVFMCQCSCSR
jgi:hypothetical protein